MMSKQDFMTSHILIIQLNLAILDELIDNKSPFYDYLLNIDHLLWQGLIGGAILTGGVISIKMLSFFIYGHKKTKLQRL